ncbi:MAG: hypothetical protein LBJ92_00770 [Holosporales bacterium]|jgi:DNA-binding transcriptional LysR family regulator|nr:hypothetical protein [Holosporales bacterium]
MSLNFSQLSQLDFFEKVCCKGFSDACREYQFELSDGIGFIQELQKSLGFVLFEDSATSCDTLTSEGSSFLPSARKLIDDYTFGLLDVYESNQKNDLLVVRSTFSYGKNLLLPCISKIAESSDLGNVGVDLITQKRLRGTDNAEAHVLFMNYTGNDQLFFDRKWTLSLDQGLYASEGYLLDIGNYPKTPEDLLSHSILGYGDVFDRDIYKSLNWHLSGSCGLCELEPSILFSSLSVITAAIETDLGIGPVINAHIQFGHKRLFRILPDVDGPNIVLDFAVRKRIPPILEDTVQELSKLMLERANELGLKIMF